MAITTSYVAPRIDPALVVHAQKEAAEIAGAFALLKAALPEVPIDTGGLYASGTVEHYNGSAAVLFSAVNPEDGYDYAGRQHEDETLHHDHGKAHYLSDPMRTAGAAITVALLTELKL